MLKLWIKLKMFYAKKRGWIHSIEQEREFVDGLTVSEIKNIVYKQDIFLGIQWDWQFDSIITMALRGADCNSIHRVWQMYYYNKGYQSYLITYTHKPVYREKLTFGQKILNRLGILYAHSFCAYFNPTTDHWIQINYGNKAAGKSLKDVINFNASSYELETKEVCIQNINWEFVNAASID